MKTGKLLVALLALLLVIPNSAGAQACGPDDYEPDQNLFEANLIQPNETQTHTFHGDAERDWLEITNLELGRIYYIRTFDLQPSTDTFVRLFDSIGNLRGVSDDIDDVLCSYYDETGVHFVDEQYCASRIFFRAKEAGSYYAAIDSLYFDAASCPAYSVEVVPALNLYLPFAPYIITQDR